MVTFLENNINPQKGAPAFLHVYNELSGEWVPATNEDIGGGGGGGVEPSGISGSNFYLGNSQDGTFGTIGLKDSSGNWTFLHDSNGDGVLTAVFGASGIQFRP